MLESWNKRKQAKNLWSTVQGYINERYFQANVNTMTKFHRMSTIQESPVIRLVFGYLVALEQAVGVVESKTDTMGKMIEVL